MPGVLFKIPLTLWVRKTIEKMNQSGENDIYGWSRSWLQAYEDLGGRSTESGKKGCPQHAAYGLWQLGRIKETGKAYQKLSLSAINQKYGKNAVYAVLALDLLRQKRASIDNDVFWSQVQDYFRRQLHEEPAISQQGAVTVAKVLYEENQIVVQES